MTVPKSHPRYVSLKIRDKIVDGVEKGITSLHGLTAHGRGEAFDYLLGEKTMESAKRSIEAAAALLLLAKYPVISVNGNAAALTGKELVQLSKAIPAKLEVNIFHPSKQREIKIKIHLIKNGAKEVLLPQKNCIIEHLDSNRKYVNGGILKADVVFVPLEDGDRTKALVKNGKMVIVVDLNPMSRSAQKATITIVDNIVRAVPLIIKTIRRYKNSDKNKLRNILKGYKNEKMLMETMKIINKNLIKNMPQNFP
ncbi:phosphopantothenate/pantothenate synthetase [Candidatus Woesearchaeota archaeon]|nr:phosphopantothenate/pantothenate synthetase [Candidatus Woesearchaeota archaeon]